MTYISVAITIFAILLGLIKTNSRVLSIVLLCLLYLFFAFENTDLPESDYNKYIDHYEAIGNGIITPHEPLFHIVCQVGNYFEVSFNFMRGIVCVVEVFIIYGIIRRYTENIALVLTLFIVYPALFDAELFRWLMGMSIVLFAFPYLIEAKSRKDYLKFFILVLLATMGHVSCFVFLIYLLLAINSKKKLTYIVLFIILMGFVLFKVNVVYSLMNYFIINDDINDKYQTGEFSNIFGVLSYTAKLSLVFLICIISLSGEKIRIGSNFIEKRNESNDNERSIISKADNHKPGVHQRQFRAQILMDKILCINIISFILVVLSVYTSQVLRLMQVVLFLNYIVLAVSCEYNIKDASRKICLALFPIVLLLLNTLFLESEGTLPVYVGHFTNGYIVNLFNTLFI